ncbi:hypothetical protein [Streptomyces sp. NBC_01750]|uniref:hypothetical protein n=1 Tax=Streptomyces sp. NBC_01750 TaxID=2975928 RepID=UPI002DDB6679|nr:hypothetical protein [Streptomyces sp. NBC_01750]WSD33430.1 hypothetical protein OG966_16860 [Streptomyces sp. NBC_01750]
MRGGIRWWWRETPRLIRLVVCTAVPLGLSMAALGIIGDANGWWDNRAFLTNLLSSLTGLLIGVPFALAVLSHLADAQAEAGARRECRRRVTAAVDRFLNTFMEGFVSDDTIEVEEALPDLRMAHEQLRRFLQQDVPDDPAVRTADARILREHLDALDAMRRRTYACDAARKHQWVTQLIQCWARLDNDIRPQAEDLGLRWLSPRVHAELANAMKRLSELDSRAFDLADRLAGRLFEAAEPPGVERWRAATSTITSRTHQEIKLAVALRRVVSHIDAVEAIGR